MAFLSSWTDNRRKKKLEARKIWIKEVGWTLQLPLNFNLRTETAAMKNYERSIQLTGPPGKNSIYQPGNIHGIFSSYHDKFNMLAGSASGIAGYSPDQIDFSHDDCKDRLRKMFLRISGVQLDMSFSTIEVGGIAFDQNSFLVKRNGKPIICMEYMYRIIGQYELSISMSYNLESIHQTMVKCLLESNFA